MSLKKFSPKDPQESLIMSFDYTGVIPDITETITMVSWGIETVVGVDNNAASMLTGQRGVQGKVVSVLVTAGINQCDYVISCIVDTNKNQGIKATALLQVRNQV